MQLIGDLVYSATDLNNFLACEHLTARDLETLLHGEERPRGTSEQAELLARLGEEHERAYLQRLAREHRVVEIIRPGAGDRGALETAAAETERRMAEGAEVIYQATFLHDGWLGHADFLRKVPGGAGRWAWHYEVEDTKLARRAEPYFLLQLCYYSEHVARIQGAAPEHAYLVLGDGTRHPFRVAEFDAYYRSVKRRFLAHVADPPSATYPFPNPHCGLCVWNDACVVRRERDDHLSLVANITRLQTARLNDRGITTLAALGRAGESERPPRMAVRTFETLRRQARLQDEQRALLRAGAANPMRYEVLRDGTEPKRGFCLLPEPSAGDVFFDIEGDPFYEVENGLEYLFGVYVEPERRYHSFWGCDRDGSPPRDRFAEKRAFEALIDFLVARRASWPEMHVYHYASYEPTALKRLAQRHATREAEVDRMLREGWLVDLYRVVRQSVAVGQPSYSIKKIEEYYGKRGEESNIKGGSESVLRFEEWLTSRSSGGERDDTILADLESYNRYDCVSTHGLRAWLLELREEAAERFAADLPFLRPDETPLEEPSNDFADLKRDLDAAIPGDFDPDAAAPADRAKLLWNARQMLDYYHRELKPVYWQFYDRLATYAEDPEALRDDGEALIELEPDGDWTPLKKSRLYPFRVPPQFQKIKPGATAYDAATGLKTGVVESLEEGDPFGKLLLKRGQKFWDLRLPRAIVVRDRVSTDALETALARFAIDLLGGATRYDAARAVLGRALPRFRARVTGDVIQPPAVDESSLLELCRALDRSYLFLQGPPGSGKTYFGARLIVGLLNDGKRIGITSQSHKAIHHLIDQVLCVADERHVSVRGFKRCSPGDPDKAHPLLETTEALGACDGNLLTGTAWAFAPPEMDERLDYLFIDEAGQLALPTALAAMMSARNVVLLGDPLQLPHVSQARHPGNLGFSVLQHLLGEELRPVAADRGVLLTDSYRMHPDVCRFVSEMMYAGRLRAACGRERQRVDSPGLQGTGVRYVAVQHTGNRQRSVEEARLIAEQIALLARGTVTEVDGSVRPFGARDAIVVTPYNAQVQCIKRELELRGLGDIEVGTVDKFQGREAYVVFFSTAASSAEEASRGASFIFDRRRFNVAISRARALAVMVGSPALLVRRCGSIEEVRTASAVCRYVELADADVARAVTMPALAMA
ncbi:MAG: TM0106 family RecB-like putative nuclease [Candidatus Eremiobacteraeota bacterium]|nr:TM0106 family RecB-like putative nuclease [Candidatus Eremiobacteraeota bacterium]